MDKFIILPLVYEEMIFCLYDNYDGPAHLISAEHFLQ